MYQRLVQSFAGIEAAVLGDSVLDRFVEGRTTRICREAPVPVVEVTSCEEAPGGAANVAANLAALGAKVRLYSAVGPDQEGRRLRSLLVGFGVHPHLITVSSRRTTTKSRFIADSQILFRFDDGSADDLPREKADELLAACFREFKNADVLILSDYGGGIFNERTIGLLAAEREQSQIFIVADSRSRLTLFSRLRPDVVKPNFREASEILEACCNEVQDRNEYILEHRDELHRATAAKLIPVTLDKEGALLLQAGRKPYRTFSQPVHDSRAAGAGDSFLAAFALALSSGARPELAADVAAAAAQVVIRKPGTVCCTKLELLNQLQGLGKVTDLKTLRELVDRAKKRGSKVVFTNGCFDILHAGSIATINRARQLGDLLIVGVNNDESVRRVKGPGRPIHRLADRIKVLNALHSVDHIMVFAEETASECLRALRPTVFAKGGTHEAQSLPEAQAAAEAGIKLVILPYLPERSTSGIIERIKRVPQDPPPTDHVPRPPT